MSPQQYREHMKSVISMLKLEHEYEKLESEIMMYRYTKLQAMEGISRYQAKDTPNPITAPISEEGSIAE
ncbi:MAG: hypothetical protein EOL97_13710 [Spirochaetia bacterium]|nr:hypothetical protein [Spirochaetia bacterium]